MRYWIISATVLFFATEALAANSSDQYSVQQHGDLLVVTYPGGQRVYVGNSEFSEERHYRIQVPIPGQAAPIAKESANILAQTQDSKPRREPMNIEAMLAKANRFYFRGDMKNANHIVDSILFADRENVRAWIMKGSLMRAQGREDLANRAWQHAKTLDPQNPFLEQVVETSTE